MIIFLFYVNIKTDLPKLSSRFALLHYIEKNYILNVSRLLFLFLTLTKIQFQIHQELFLREAQNKVLKCWSSSNHKSPNSV